MYGTSFSISVITFPLKSVTVPVNLTLLIPEYEFKSLVKFDSTVNLVKVDTPLLSSFNLIELKSVLDWFSETKEPFLIDPETRELEFIKLILALVSFTSPNTFNSR